MNWENVETWPVQQLAFAALNELGGPTLRDNPYPFYERLRTQTPVLRVPGSPAAGIWLLSRYIDVHAALTDERCSAEMIWARLDPIRPGILIPDRSPFGQSMLGSEGPRHRRLRAIAAPPFMRRRVGELRVEIAAWVDALLEPALRARRIDVVRDLAGPLPTLVTGRLLGLRLEGESTFRTWSNAFIDGVGTGSPGGLFGDPSMSRLASHLYGELVDRRTVPGDDLLSAMLACQRAAPALEDAELLSTLLLLVVAGLETTAGLIGNSVLALSRAPEQLERLRQDRVLLPAAIEELLRYDSPVQAVVRVARDEMFFSGIRVPEGALLLALIGAAHRDPERFERPDELDWDRTDVEHLAFGLGRHHCLGATLARLEAEIALRAMLDRFETWSLGPAPLQRRPSPVVRSLRSLPMAF